MRNLIKNARWATIGAAALLPFAGGCDLKQSLLSPQQPGVIGPTSVTTPTGAEALRVGALGSFKAWFAGGGVNFANLPMMSDLVTDVWASGDSDGSRALVENIRDLHPDTPVVLTTPGLALSWEESSGRHGVTMLSGQPTGARLHEAIQEALASSAAAADA